MKEWRVILLLSGLMGLACNALLFVGVALLQRAFLPPLFTEWLFVLPLFLLCLTLSLGEMPIMVMGLRKLAADPKRKSLNLLAFTNGLYVCFAAFYAGLFVLLTGMIWVGGGLSALGFARLASSLIFVDQPAK